MPLGHIFLASCIAVSVGVGFWYRSSKLPVDYVSSALLSYEEPQHLQTDSQAKDADSPIVRIAESRLSPSVLLKVADRVQFPNDGARGRYSTGASATDAGARARSEAFRSHVGLTEPAPGLLQVTFRGANAGLVFRSTNAIAGVLAAWTATPAPPPHPSDSAVAKSIAAPQAPLHMSAAPAPAPAVQIRPDTPEQQPGAENLLHRAAGLEENIATLALQQRNLERDIADLLKQRDGLSSASAADHARRAAITSQLGELRSLRETLMEQRESQLEQVQGLKARAAALRTSTPAPAPADPTSSTTPSVAIANSHPSAPSPPVEVQRVEATSTQQTWGGSFTIIDRAQAARLVTDDRKKVLLWAGLGVAFASAVFYLALVAWRYRPISDPNTLRRLLSGAKYFGAVAGNPIAEKSS